MEEHETDSFLKFVGEIPQRMVTTIAYVDEEGTNAEANVVLFTNGWWGEGDERPMLVRKCYEKIYDQLVLAKQVDKD